MRAGWRSGPAAIGVSGALAAHASGCPLGEQHARRGVGRQIVHAAPGRECLRVDRDAIDDGMAAFEAVSFPLGFAQPIAVGAGKSSPSLITSRITG